MFTTFKNKTRDYVLGIVISLYYIAFIKRYVSLRNTYSRTELNYIDNIDLSLVPFRQEY